MTSFLMILLAALAQGPTASSNKTPAAAVIKRIEGVYKRRFANSTVQEEHFESEDILELVPYGSDKVYFRVHLEFYNGHTCDLLGIAKYEDGAFVYRGPAGDTDVCVLTMRAGKKDLTLDDVGGNCKSASCGARGGYHGAGFPLTSRRAIRYMARLKAGKEYANAVAEYEKSVSH
jgi:hypothetical protein